MKSLMIRRDEPGNRSSNLTVKHCRYCRRYFLQLCAIQKIIIARFQSSSEIVPTKHLKKEESYMNAINNRRYGHSHTNIGNKCCSLSHSTTECANQGGRMRRPTRLKSRSVLVVNQWCRLFAEKAGISVEFASKMVQNANETWICSVHMNLLKATLLEAEKDINKCSLCCCSSDSTTNITVFNWDSFSKKQENVCVIEDALLSSPYRMVRPEDIARLCDSCRRMLLRDVDVRADQPRDSRLSVDYGKTPIAIMQCVTFVRRQLRMKETILV